jgi:hypothetical protein
MLINRGRGYKNLRYLLLKAKRMAVTNVEFLAVVRRQLVLRIDVNYFSRRVASIKNVTELLIVVGGRLQGLSDILRRQLVRLDTVW